MASPVFSLSLERSAGEARKFNFQELLDRCDRRLQDTGTFVIRPWEGPAGFDPELLVESSQSEYARQQTIGGHSPVHTFLRNSNRIVQFSIDFRADGYALPSEESRMRQVRWPVALFDSLCYPVRDASSNAVLPPPLVRVAISTIFEVRGFISALSINWGTGWGPGLDGDALWLPDSASLAVTLSGVGIGGGGYDGSAYYPFQSAYRGA
jgi:hypothetical protein